VQPAQLSLLPDQVPSPAPMVLAELPEADVAEAINLFASIIAKTSKRSPVDETTPKEVGADD
jgi:hypothetical protein